MNSENTMRNFEEEYRKYAKSSAPDLWDRIEAGIDALTAAAAGSEQTGEDNTEKITKIEEYKKADAVSSTDTPAEVKKAPGEVKAGAADKKAGRSAGRKRIQISRYMGIVAAAACGLLVVSAAGWISLSSKSNSAAEAAYAPAAPAASEAMAEEAAAEPMAEEYEESAPMAEEAAAESMAEGYEEAAPMADEAAPEAEAAAPVASGSSAAETGGAYAAVTDSYEEAAAEEEYEESQDAPEAADNTATAEAEEMDNIATLKADEKKADTDRADGLNASSKKSKSGAKQDDQDRQKYKEQQLTVVLDSLKEEDGKLICTMVITDPGITKHKEGDTVTAFVNEPIKSRVSKFYGKKQAAGDDQYAVTLVPLDSGFLITDIRREFK